MKLAKSLGIIMSAFVIAVSLVGCGTGGGLSPDEFIKDVTIEETTIVENEKYQIVAKSLKVDEYEAELELVFNNKSGKKLDFYSGNIGSDGNAINNYMGVGGYLSCEVEPNSEATETISFDINDLLLCGISGIAEIDLAFSVSDEDYNSEEIEANLIKTSIAESYDMSSDDFAKNFESTIKYLSNDVKVDAVLDETVYDERGIVINSVALATNKDGEKNLFLEIQNNNEDTLYIQTGQYSLNGVKIYEEDNWSYDGIRPHKTYVLGCSLNDMLKDTTLEDKGITKIKDVEFDISVYKGWQKVNGPNKVNFSL